MVSAVLHPAVARTAFRSAQKIIGGILPAFLSAFIGNKQLTQQEADELRRMIAEFEEKRND